MWGTWRPRLVLTAHSHCLSTSAPSTIPPLMTAATNRVIPMPEASDKKSTEPAEVGHRSTQRASMAEKPAVVQKTGDPVLAADADKGVRATQTEPATEVFAVFGVEPEIQAYAMAKYSRSALSMKESLREISSQKAEKFLNTFYFQYGHRSIA